MLLDQVEERLYAILCTGYGLTPAVVGAPSGYPLPAGTFRRSVVPLDLMAEEPAAAAFDRSVWLAMPRADIAYETQARQDAYPYDVVAQVVVGYLWGPDQQGGLFYPSTLNAADIAYAKLHPQQRALSDARLMRRALCEPTLFSDGPTSPPIFGVTGGTSTSVSVLPTGRAIAVTEFSVHLFVSQSGSY